MKCGSLFSGIGGFDLAIHWMGWETAWFSEIDPYCCAVLKHHWPDVPNLGDITKVDWSTVERPDLLCGGFPCQDISNAGKRAGIRGERSGLWSEFARAIRELRPRHVVVENVAALLGRGLDRVLGDLAESGYDAEWQVLSAADVGAPHLRERLWVTAYADGQQHQGRSHANERPATADFLADAEGLAERAGLRPSESGGIGRGRSSDGGGAMAYPDCDERQGRERLSGLGGQGDAHPQRRGRRRTSAPNCADTNLWATEPDVRGMVDGLPAELDCRRETFPTPDCQIHRDGTKARKAAYGRHGVSLHHYIEGTDAGQRVGAESFARGGPEEVMRELWSIVASRAASSGRESNEQLAEELADALCWMSHGASLVTGEERLEAAFSILHGLREACEAVGALRNPSESLAATWIALSREAQDWVIVAAGRGSWHAEWPGIPRVSVGVPSRVDRLTGLGNAIVPACALEIFSAIQAAERRSQCQER